MTNQGENGHFGGGLQVTVSAIHNPSKSMRNGIGRHDPLSWFEVCRQHQHPHRVGEEFEKKLCEFAILWYKAAKNARMSIMNLKSVINLNVRIVETWYEVEKGRPLTRENLKKMRQRGNFERLVEVARRWRLGRIAQRKVTCPDQDQLDHSVRKFAP